MYSMLSDSNSTLEALKLVVRRFCEERDWGKYHNAKDLVIGVVTEASELLELMRFKSEAEVEGLFRNAETRAKICAEAADVLYFLLRLADLYGIDLARELEAKLEANAAKYPVEKFRGSNKKYDEV